MSAEARVEWTGNIQVHHPAKPGHTMVADQVLCSATTTYLCTGCSWTVEAHRVPGAAEAVERAFAKHVTEAEP